MQNQPQKHHYRNVFKSDHLGSADLEEYIEQGRKLIFVISHVRQEFGAKVAGKKGNFNIAYFTEQGVKPLVLNATNSKQIRQFAAMLGGDAFVETWNNIPVELYIDENVKAVTGGTTQGVRIRPAMPVIGEKPKPVFSQANFQKAKEAGATIDQIKERYQITPEVESEYLKYAAEV